MKTMKRMSVKKHNMVLNVVNFLSTGQDSGEPAKHFYARLKAQVALCSFKLPAGETDYSDRMVMFMLVRLSP